MPQYTTDDIRNVALVGHGGAGKTTLVEALLAHAGVIGAPGSVTKGTSVCDFDPQEKEHQHSLFTAVANFDHGSRHVNLVDTPGYPDFLGRALPVLAAVETAAVVVDARQGVQMVTRRMMEAAAGRGLARMVVVNKIDADELDLEALLGRPRGGVRHRVHAHQTCLRAVGGAWWTASSSRERTPSTSRRWRKRTPASSTRWSRSTRS